MVFKNVLFCQKENFFFTLLDIKKQFEKVKNYLFQIGVSTY